MEKYSIKSFLKNANCYNQQKNIYNGLNAIHYKSFKHNLRYHIAANCKDYIHVRIILKTMQLKQKYYA